MNPKFLFFLQILMVVIPASLVFPFVVTVLNLPHIIVTGNNPILPNKETFYFYLMMGVGIQALVMTKGIRGLWKGVKQNKLG